YVGLVLAASFGEPLYDYIARGHGAPVSQTQVKLLLLVIPIILLQFGRRHEKHAHKHNVVITLIQAFLTAMLIASSVLSQLGPLELSRVTDQSSLASWIYDFRLLWLAGVPLAIAASALIKPKP